MHFTAPILLALSAASTIQASWTIPADQPDGVYVVSVDVAGVSHHEKVEPTASVERRTPVNSAKFSPKPALFPRETYEISCPGYYLNHANADWVVSNLGSQCGSNGVVGGHLSFYAKTGQAVAYFCNNNGGSNTCYSWEVQDALVNKGSSVCGSYAAAIVKFVSKGGTYGQDVNTAKFC